MTIQDKLKQIEVGDIVAVKELGEWWVAELVETPKDEKQLLRHHNHEDSGESVYVGYERRFYDFRNLGNKIISDIILLEKVSK